MESRKRSERSERLEGSGLFAVAKLFSKEERAKFLIDHQDRYTASWELKKAMKRMSGHQGLTLAQNNRHLISGIQELASIAEDIPNDSLVQFIKDQEKYWRQNGMYEKAMVTDRVQTTFYSGVVQPQGYLSAFMSVLDALQLVEADDNKVSMDFVERNMQAVINVTFLIWVMWKLKDPGDVLEVATNNMDMLYSPHHLLDAVQHISEEQRYKFIDDLTNYWVDHEVEYGFEITDVVKLMKMLPGRDGRQLAQDFIGCVEDKDDLLKILNRLDPNDRVKFTADVERCWSGEQKQPSAKRSKEADDSERPAKKAKVTDGHGDMFASGRLKQAEVELLKQPQMTTRSNFSCNN